MTSRDLLHRLPTVFNPKAASNVNCVIQFETTEPGYITIDNGTCSVSDGVAPRHNLLVTISDQNLTDLLKGKLNPVTGLMFRKLKAEGDLDLGARLTSFFDFSKM